MISNEPLLRGLSLKEKKFSFCPGPGMRVTGQNLKDLIEIFFIFLRTFIKVHTWFVMASAPGPVGGKISRCWRRQGVFWGYKVRLYCGNPLVSVFDFFLVENADQRFYVPNIKIGFVAHCGGKSSPCQSAGWYF